MGHMMGCLGRGYLACRTSHGGGAVGAGALPHGQSTWQLQFLKESCPSDVCRLGTLTGAQGQHAAHHTQLKRHRTQRDVRKALWYSY